jgi:hypothetical protein
MEQHRTPTATAACFVHRLRSFTGYIYVRLKWNGSTVLSGDTHTNRLGLSCHCHQYQPFTAFSVTGSVSSLLLPALNASYPPFPPAPVHIVEGCWWQRSCPYAAVTGCWRHIPCKYEICDIRFARFSRPLSVRLSRHFAAVALGCVQVFLYVHQTSELARRPVAPEGLLQRSAHALDRCRRRAWTPTSASAH